MSFADGKETPTTLEQLLKNTTNREPVENSGCGCDAQIAHKSLVYDEVGLPHVVARRAIDDVGGPPVYAAHGDTKKRGDK